MSDFDVIVIGAGHNGLTCAGYLARAGLRVKVLERRAVVGGAALTEEFHPGFRNSVYSYAVSLLNPNVIRDLELEKHGLEILPRTAGVVSLLTGDYLALPRDEAGVKRELGRHSPTDVEAYFEFERRITSVALVLRQMAEQTPPALDGGWAALPALLRDANLLRKLDAEQRVTLGDLFTKSLGHYLDLWFESPSLKGILGLEGVIGNYADPYQAGTAYVLLHHAFGEVNGKVGAWGIARGGMGSISAAMAAFVRSKGVDIETDASVARVVVEKGKTCGVELSDGRVLRAGAVAGNVHPQTLLLQMLEAKWLDSEQRRRLQNYRSHSATFRMNVALSELPRFDHLPCSDEAALSAAIELCPSLPYLQQAFADAQTTGWSQKCIVSMYIPSTQDDSLAPPGCHVASLFCQHFQRHLPDGRNWDDVKQRVADQIIDQVAAHSQNFRRAVVGMQIKSPLDIERDLGMVGGDIFHGALHPDQLYALRPVPGLADYRMPVQGLYLCGSGAHPGGGVTGLPGRNAAAEILRDLEGRRW